MSIDSIFEKAATSPHTLIRGLLADGYDFINHTGNTFASCLVKPDADEVVIVNIDPYCARAFYQYCMDNPDNPLLPRVHDLRDFNGGCMTRMERLVALDHIELDKRDEEMLGMLAPSFVAYMRAETDPHNTASMAAGNQHLEKTVRDVLAMSQAIYRNTDKEILPFCDIKADNVFLRSTPQGPQFVFGDPLFPGAGNNPDNIAFMEKAYKRFGLPPLEASSAPAPAPSLQHA